MIKTFLISSLWTTIIPLIISAFVGALFSYLATVIQKKQEEKKNIIKEKNNWLKTLLTDNNKVYKSFSDLYAFDEKAYKISLNKNTNPEDLAKARFDRESSRDNVAYNLNTLKADFINYGFYSGGSTLENEYEFNIPVYNFSFYDDNDYDMKKIGDKGSEIYKYSKIESKNNFKILKALNDEKTNLNKEAIIIELIDFLLQSLRFYVIENTSKAKKIDSYLMSSRNIKLINQYKEKLHEAILLYVKIAKNNLN